MSANIDSLNIEIKANATSASNAIDKLTNSLKTLQKGVAGLDTTNLKNLSVNLRELGQGMAQLSKMKMPDYTRTVKGLQQFNKLNGGNLGQLGTQLGTLGNAMNTFSSVKFDNSSGNRLVKFMQKLSTINVQNVDTNAMLNLATGIKRVANELQGTKAVSANTIQFTNAIARLGATSSTLGSTSNSLVGFGTALKKVVNDMSTAGTVADDTILFTNAIGNLANAGNKTGLAAKNLGTLGVELRKFFNEMSKAPTVNRNIIDMTNALANLSAQGRGTGNALRGLGASFNSTHTPIKRTTKHFMSLSSAIGKFYAKWFLVLRAVQGFGKAIEKASHNTELDNVVVHTFAEDTDKLEEFTSKATDAFGMSKISAKEIASRFQAMGKAMDIDTYNLDEKLDKSNGVVKKFGNGLYDTTKEVSDMSINLTKLTADYASFYDVEQKEVAETMESIYTGQNRPMRRFGIDLTEANIKAWALRNGIQVNMETMSQAEKVILRYNYVLSQSGEIMGDFVRTSDSWHNIMTSIKSNYEDLLVTIGNIGVNVFKPLIVGASNALKVINDFALKVLNSLGEIFGWKATLSVGASEESAYADELSNSLDDATASAKKLNKQLQGFHELNVLTTQDKGGSGAMTGFEGYGDALAESKVIIEETESIFESEWDTLYKLGKGIGDSITKGLKSIDWDSVYQSAKNFGTGLADFLNGLISPELFYETGKTIAKSIGTAFTSVNAFATTFDWHNLGNSIGSGINGYFKNNDIVLQVETIMKIANGVLTSLISAISVVDWAEIGSQVGKAINNIDWSGLVLNLGELALHILNAIGKAITGLGSENPLASAIISAVLAMKVAGKFNSVGSKILQSIGNAMSNSGVEISVPSTSTGSLGTFCTKAGKAIGGALGVAAAGYFGFKFGEWLNENFLGGAYGKFQKTVNDGLDFWRGTDTWLGKGVRQLVGDDEKAFQEQHAKEKENAKRFTPMGKFIRDIDSELEERESQDYLMSLYGVDTMDEVYSIMRQKAEKGLTDVSKTVKQKGKVVGTAFTTFWNNIKKSLPKKVQSAIDSMNVDKAEDKGKSVVSKFSKGIGVGWESIQSFLTNKEDTMISKVTTDKWRTQSSTIVNKVNDGISKGWDVVNNTVSQKRASASANLVTDEWRQRGNAIQGLFNSGIGTWNDVNSKIASRRTTASANLVTDEWRQRGIAVQGLFNGGLGTNWAAVNSKINSMKTTASSYLAGNEWRARGSAVPGLFKSGIDSNWSTTSNAIYKSFYSSGGYLVDGLKNGINSTWSYRGSGGLLSTISNLAGNLTSALRKAFGIKSPSRVWAGVGYWLDMGLVKGITDDIPTIENTVSDLAYAMNNKLNSAMEPMNASLSSGLGIDDVNVVGNISKEFNASLSTTSSEQNALLRQQNELLLQILQKEGITSSDVFDAVRQQSRNYYNQTGKNALAF